MNRPCTLRPLLRPYQTDSLPGGCSGQRMCPHAQLGIPKTAHGPPLEYHQLHSLTHTPSWVYRRRLTGHLWNTASSTHSHTRPAGYTEDGSRPASGIPPAPLTHAHAQLGIPKTAHGPPLEYRQLHSLTHTPSWVYRRRLTGRLWNTASSTHSLTHWIVYVVCTSTAAAAAAASAARTCIQSGISVRIPLRINLGSMGFSISFT
jgi:hypothetical protein